MFSRPALLGPVILIVGRGRLSIYWFYAASIGEDLVTRWIEHVLGIVYRTVRSSDPAFPFWYVST